MNTLVICSKCEKMNRVDLVGAQKSTPICGNCKSELPLHSAVQDLNGSRLEKLVRLADRPIVVDFWAEWCGPCKSFAPTFKSAAAQLGGKIIFSKVNTEASPDAGQRYQIKSIPTLIFFQGGLEVERHSGAMPLSLLLEKLSRWK